MAGAFRVYQYPPDTNNPEDIAFELQPDFIGPVPEDQEKLKGDVERALTIISAIYGPSHIRFKYYFPRLLSLSQMGLVGLTANPPSAQRTLQGLLKEFAEKEGSEVKRRYINSINSTTLYLSIIPAIIALLFTVFPEYFGEKFPKTEEIHNAGKISDAIFYIGNFFFVFSSCVIGIWLSSVAKAGSIEFNRLHIIEEWQIRPLTRTLFISIITVILSLLVYKQFIVLSIGGISFSSFYKDPITSIIFGALCGLGERIMSAKVTKQAESLFSDMK